MKIPKLIKKHEERREKEVQDERKEADRREVERGEKEARNQKVAEAEDEKYQESNEKSGGRPGVIGKLKDYLGII
jgi:hypothetical protein